MTKQAEMDKAIEAWLKSHAAYRQYLSDTTALYEAFAATFYGSQKALTEAFENYREALLAANGYSHSEIRELYPRRASNTDSGSTH